MTTMEVDEAMDRLGGFRGKWQLVCFCFLSSSMMVPACINLLNIIFVGLVPPHYCLVPENTSLPVERDTGVIVTSQCLMFSPNRTDNATERCVDGWTYDVSDIGETIVSEFDLVCGSEWLISTAQTLLVAGMTVGSVVIAPLPDQFGRKPVHLVCVFLLSMVSLATSFCYHYISYAILRVLTGILIIGSLSAMIATVELFSASARGKAGILVQIPWTFAMFLLLFLAYFLRNWRQLQLVIGLVPLVFLFGYWVYPESVPWLVVQGRYREAEDILQRAAVGSGVRMPKQILYIPPEPPDKEKKKKWSQKICDPRNRENLLLLIKSPMMRKHAGIMLCVWFCNALVYYGISFLSVTWAGNRFLNFFLNALVEIPAIALCLLTLEKFGRRLPIASFHIGAGLCLLISLFVPEKSGSVDLGPPTVTLNVLAKTFITSSFDGVWLYSPELFPTNLRSSGIGIVQFGARAGAMIAPFSMALASSIPWLPGVVFSFVSVICGLLVLFLPETFNKPLAQSLTEMQRWPQDACIDVFKSCCKRLDRQPADVDDSHSIQTDITHISDLKSTCGSDLTKPLDKQLASIESSL